MRVYGGISSLRAWRECVRVMLKYLNHLSLTWALWHICIFSSITIAAKGEGGGNFDERNKSSSWRELEEAQHHFRLLRALVSPIFLWIINCDNKKPFPDATSASIAFAVVRSTDRVQWRRYTCPIPTMVIQPKAHSLCNRGSASLVASGNGIIDAAYFLFYVLCRLVSYLLFLFNHW